MKVVCAFKLDDGIITEEMTLEEIDEKIKKYGLTEKELKNMFFRYFKILLESSYDVVVNLKVK